MALRTAAFRSRGRLRGLGRAHEDPGRHPGEAARARDLPRSHRAAHRPRPPPAGRGGRPRAGQLGAGSRAPLRRRALLGEGRTHPGVGNEATRARLPARDPVGRRPWRAARSAPARRRRSDDYRNARGPRVAPRRKPHGSAGLGAPPLVEGSRGHVHRGERQARQGRRRAIRAPPRPLRSSSPRSGIPVAPFRTASRSHPGSGRRRSRRRRTGFSSWSSGPRRRPNLQMPGGRLRRPPGPPPPRRPTLRHHPSASRSRSPSSSTRRSRTGGAASRRRTERS